MMNYKEELAKKEIKIIVKRKKYLIKNKFYQC